MADLEKITSTQNPRIKHVLRLRKHSERDAEKVVLIEGYREIRRAVDNRHPITTLFHSPDLFLGENEPKLIDDCRKAGAEIIECGGAAFARISYRDRPDGLLAIAPQVTKKLKDLRLPENPLLLVCVSIEKPGNLGTMLRTADATGVDAVLVCDPTTDVHNPNVVRASVGTLFTVPVVECSSEEARHWLRERGIQTLATTPDTENIYFGIDMRPSTALILGCEQLGLDRPWLEQADHRIRIPMLGQADSLNVSAACTLVLYEAVRQRKYTSTSLNPPGTH